MPEPRYYVLSRKTSDQRIVFVVEAVSMPDALAKLNNVQRQMVKIVVETTTLERLDERIERLGDTATSLSDTLTRGIERFVRDVLTSLDRVLKRKL